MESNTDVFSCLNQMIRGVKPTNRCLFPILPHLSEVLFDSENLKAYLKKEGNLLKENCATSFTIEGDTFEKAIESFGTKFCQGGSGTYGLASLSGTVSAEFDQQLSNTSEVKYSQIRKVVQYSKISLPASLFRENLRALLKTEVATYIDSINTLKAASSFVETFGPFYIQSSYLGALLTFSTTTNSLEVKSSKDLTSSLSAELNYMAASTKGEHSIKMGVNTGVKNTDMSIIVSAVGGNPSKILNGKESDWVESAQENLALVDAVFAPIYQLAGAGSKSETLLKQAVEEYFEKEKFNLSKIIGSNQYSIKKKFEGFDESAKYKITNVGLGGNLFSGKGFDIIGDYYVWVSPEDSCGDELRETWKIKCVNKISQIYKIFNCKRSGPLFCGNSGNSDYYYPWISTSIDYNSNSKEYWKIVPNEDCSRFKIISVKTEGPLYCSKDTDYSGDRYPYICNNAKFVEGDREYWYINKHK
jgi:hypothetical protein